MTERSASQEPSIGPKERVTRRTSARFAAAEANGAHVHRMTGFHGAARLHAKTVEEMSEAREESRKNAQAADKGKMTTNA